MNTREERDQERRRYEGDVMYEVWRREGNPDRVDYDRVQDAYYDGLTSDEAASREMKRQRPKPEPEAQEEADDGQG